MLTPSVVHCKLQYWLFGGARCWLVIGGDELSRSVTSGDEWWLVVAVFFSRFGGDRGDIVWLCASTRSGAFVRLVRCVCLDISTAAVSWRFQEQSVDALLTVLCTASCHLARCHHILRVTNFVFYESVVCKQIPERWGPLIVLSLSAVFWEDWIDIFFVSLQAPYCWFPVYYIIKLTPVNWVIVMLSAYRLLTNPLHFTHSSITIKIILFSNAVGVTTRIT